ncbi:MAG TPA: nucleotidyltransferase domain-containing protein [Stellaceae bacterium]|nr:nucleotidyltransferase domain-containing protein [Stellaceae bacterium]
MNAIRKWAIKELRRMVLDALGAHDAAVWLFGSCARGEVRQHSDIDIAILPRDELPLGFFGELQADIEDSKIPYDVDLVDLTHADSALVDAVRREGIPWRN